MKISGLVIASDGANKKGVIDFLDIPFYGGDKFLMKDKILSRSTKLANEEPLISSSIKAMGESLIIHDFVIVGKKDQCEELESLAAKYCNGKHFEVVPNEGHIGETVALGSENIRIPGYFFIVQPDLPFLSGKGIDEVVLEMSSKFNPEVSVYFPVISKAYFEKNSSGWNRQFFLHLQNNHFSNRYKSLDFVIADSLRINPEFIRKFYNIRMIKSLRGKLNLLREVPKYLPKAFIKHNLASFSVSDLEEIASEINQSSVQILELESPYAHQFMKDIDTKEDYQTYLNSLRT